MDIQDAFDSLVLCEDSLVTKAYEEGLVEGEKVGFQEVFNLGLEKGSEIGAEIFFYRGFARSWITLLSQNESDFSKTFHELLEPCQSSLGLDIVIQLKQIYPHLITQKAEETDPKSRKVLQKLLELLESFPQNNPKSEDILGLLQDIRAKFKHCCAILKVDANYCAKNQLNF